MVLFLGIDGGGTGCRAAIADAHGRILGEGIAGPANVNTDTEGTRLNILAATHQALSGTGAAMGDLVATLGLAGANVSGVARELGAALPFARAEIVSDAITAARGALGRQDGIVAAMGTGSVFAVSRDGTLRQYGGRGFVLGDEGSGAVLGRRNSRVTPEPNSAENTRRSAGTSARRRVCKRTISPRSSASSARAGPG